MAGDEKIAEKTHKYVDKLLSLLGVLERSLADKGKAGGAGAGMNPKRTTELRLAIVESDSALKKLSKILKLFEENEQNEQKEQKSVTELLAQRAEKKLKREKKREEFAQWMAKRGKKENTVQEKNGFKAAHKASGAADSEGANTTSEFELLEETLIRVASLKAGSLPWAARWLGIAVTSNLAMARQAYRARAKSFHPDVNSHPKASWAFHNLQDAMRYFEELDKRLGQHSGGVEP
jgi:hypothetical protein